MKISRDELLKLYQEKELSICEISKIVGIKKVTLYWYMKKYDIPRRSPSVAGKNSWKKGTSKVTDKMRKVSLINVKKARTGITDKSRKKQSSTMMKKYDDGMKPWNFKEGAQSELNRRVRRPRWMKLSEEIKERDNYTCQKCKTKDITLHVHHVDGNAENNNHENLITVCASCHMKESWQLGQIK